MSAISLRLAQARLMAGEPVRILIGERFYDASEIVPVPDFAAELRERLIGDLDRQFPGEPEPPEPAAPAQAMTARAQRHAS